MLRQQLQEMTEEQDVAQHPDLLGDISAIHANTIRLLESEVLIDRYTCLVHVFHLVDKPEYVEIASMGFGRVYAGTEFANWLLEREKLEEVEQMQAATGDIVFYFDGNQFKHTGIISSPTRIISKWGVGHLYEHDLFEAPISYGELVRYFRRPTPEDAYSYFTEFAEEHGIKFRDAAP